MLHCLFIINYLNFFKFSKINMQLQESAMEQSEINGELVVGCKGLGLLGFLLRGLCLIS